MYVTISVYFVGRSDDEALVFNTKADDVLYPLKRVCDGYAVEDLDGTWHAVSVTQIRYVEAYDATEFLGDEDEGVC